MLRMSKMFQMSDFEFFISDAGIRNSKKSCAWMFPLHYSKGEITAMEKLDARIILNYPYIFQKPEQPFNEALTALELHVCWMTEFSEFL